MNRIRKVAVLGAGAGGCACAAVLTRKGYEVRLYNRTPQRLEPIQERGGLEILDGEFKGLVKIAAVTSDLAAAVRGADLIQVMTTACGHRDLARALGPLVRPGQVVVLCSGAAGSLEFSRIWAEVGVKDGVLLGETATMPQAARIRGPAQVTIKLPAAQRTAAFPGKRTAELCAVLSPLYTTIPVRDVLDTGINNPNWLIHPIPMVLNYAEIERQNGLFSLMNEGMTESVLRGLDAFDRERMALQRMLDLPVVSVDALYTEFGSGPWVYRSKGEPMGFKDKIHMRYIDEDIPYGSMFLSSLGDLIGVHTPVMDATNLLAEVITGKDYWSEARTPETLGLAGMDFDRILHYLEEGGAAR